LSRSTIATATSAEPLLPGFEERRADVRGVPMRYYVGGDGSPLVLVHGLSGASTNWCELAPLLARRRRVLIPDLPGQGGSEPLPAAPSLNGYADRMRHLAGLEQMLPAPFVGHSLGGSVALRAAIRWPADVPAVVLAASAGIASTTRWAQFWLAFFDKAKPGRRIAPHRSVVARRRALRYAVFGYWGASDPAALTERAVDGLLAGPQLHSDTVSAARALVRDDPRQDLHEIGCRCLVLWGARDHQVPIDDAFDYARRLGAPLRVIADCGHLLVAERPDACLDAIEDFLGRLGL
jgi:pimeloyl-ACP methyl ester carboxylesterase